MVDAPRYPHGDDDGRAELFDRVAKPSRPSRSMLIVFVLVAVLIAVMVVAHLAGLAPTH
ncbi:MAG TPA: hypothetical protein VHT75_20630 [Acidimicrobiales bacterium]|jgi:hypothetical protein|nr:hypothetical protein [Acidimicrobiales bacterium]